MALKIRLSRAGSKKRPVYRVVVADSRSPRDGRFIEKVGLFNPLLNKDNKDRVQLDQDNIKEWLSKGAKPTDKVAKILGAAGLIPMPAQGNNPKKAQPKKKAQERLAAAQEVAGFHAHQQSIPGDAGIVDQNVQASAALQHGFDQSVHLLFKRDIGLQGVGLSTSSADRGHHLVGGAGGIGIVHNHFRSGFRQREGNGPSDASTSAGHQCGLACKGCKGGHDGCFDRRIVGSRWLMSQPGMVSIVSTASPSSSWKVRSCRLLPSTTSS